MASTPDQRNLSFSKGKSSKPASGERPRTSPDLFTEGSTTPVTSSLPLWEASNILAQRKHLPWVMDPDGKLCYTRDVSDGQGAIYFWVTENIEDEHPATLAGAAALAVIDNFDIRAACMHLIYAAHAAQVARPWEEEIIIDDRQIEAYLGLQKRTDKSRKEKLSLIEEIAKQPCKITTYITWPQQGRQKGFTVEEGRLWHILGTRYHYQQDIFGNKEIAGISFIIKAGLWAKYFLNEDISQDYSLPTQQGTLSKHLLASIMSIWQHREGAARLMIWLLFKSQTNKQYPFNAQTLMEVAYGPKKVEDAKSDLQLRKKLANTWDEDLFTLHDRGWRINFDSDTYSADIQPVGFGRSDSRRPRGFFKRLLGARLWIYPPDEWITQKLTISTQKTPDTNVVQNEEVSEWPTLTGEEVRDMRTSRAWSQRKLATLTGISQGLISMIENGSRSITEDNELILRRVFDYM
ncbi:helix-turn-helix domain-containing protein [Almyronema epifaneia]|uniref:Multiprotein-bridging factor 1 family protein n=1 Tax=Almyronema epifaneia S1 TaxID=2991925 RepID=A0ABW6IJP6_9CYAN